MMMIEQHSAFQSTLENAGDEDTVKEEAEAKGWHVRQGSAQEEGPRRRGSEDIGEPAAQGEMLRSILSEPQSCICFEIHQSM